MDDYINKFDNSKTITPKNITTLLNPNIDINKNNFNQNQLSDDLSVSIDIRDIYSNKDNKNNKTDKNNKVAGIVPNNMITTTDKNSSGSQLNEDMDSDDSDSSTSQVIVTKCDANGTIIDSDYNNYDSDNDYDEYNDSEDHLTLHQHD